MQPSDMKLVENAMALNLSEDDHNVLDQYLNAILDAYRSGAMEQSTARGHLVHTIAAAAKDNDGMMADVQAVLGELTG